MGYPTTQNYMDQGGDRFTVGQEGEFRLLGALTGGLYVKRYYVDNVNGAAENDGLSWGTAFAQITTAVTAWEAFRAAETNVYARGAIFVRGTDPAYTKLTALPSYCDIIGVGAESNGNGTGIVKIGADGADGIAGTARGLGLYNLQIISGGAFWCCDFVNLFRSRIERCCFQAKDHATSGAIRFSSSSGGINIINCHMTGSGNVIHAVGIQVQGGNFDSCRIEDNIIIGTTAGVLIDNTCSTGLNGTAADNTIFRHNVIGDLGRGCVIAIDDNSPAGMINYIENSVMGTSLITCANNGAARVHGNVSANGFVAVTAS